MATAARVQDYQVAIRELRRLFRKAQDPLTYGACWQHITRSRRALGVRVMCVLDLPRERSRG
jgi:hypothetical protein